MKGRAIGIAALVCCACAAESARERLSSSDASSDRPRVSVADAGAPAIPPSRDVDADDRASWLVCVTAERSGEIVLIDGASSDVVARIPVGKRPRGIDATSDGSRLYVALSGSPILGPPQLDAHGAPIERAVDPDENDPSADGIGVVDLDRRELVAKLRAGSDPEEFAVSRDGSRIFASNEDVGTVSVIDVASGEVDRIVRVEAEPEGVALAPDGRSVWVTCETDGAVFVFDATTNDPPRRIEIGGRPRSVAFLPDGTRAFVTSETGGRVHVVDAMQLAVLRAIELPAGSRPMGTAITSDGRTLFVSNGRAGTVSVVDLDREQVVATIAVGKRPWGIALSPDEKRLYVANGPSDDVSVVDVARREEIARVAVGGSPWGIVVVARRAAESTDHGRRDAPRSGR